MNTAAVQTKRKNIDIREDVYRFLSIKAAASGTNLKSYIEALLEKEVEERTLRTGLGYEEVRNASCLDELDKTRAPLTALLEPACRTSCDFMAPEKPLRRIKEAFYMLNAPHHI